MENMAAVAAPSTSKLLTSSFSLLSHGILLRSSPGRSVFVQPRIRSRRNLSVSAASRGGRTLSEGWNLSGSIAGPAAFRMPSFEELDTTNMLLRQRIVFLGSQVDTMTADLVISQLLFLDAEDQQKEIKLFINSPGGSVTAGMGIYDAMKLCKADVSTVCLGLAASMGAFLLAAGTKGKRFCMPNAKVMIHQPMGSAGGKATEMALQIREMMYHKIKMVKILSRITGKPEHQLEVDTARDFFMNPWEAKEYGLVDAVIDDGKPGLVAPLGDATAPPKTLIWDFWTAEEMKKHRQNLPSEEKLLRNGNKADSSNDDTGKELPKEEPTTV